MNELDFTGWTVIVTGGSSGIGAAVVTAFQNRGASVFSFDVNRPNDPEVRWFTVDVTRAAQVEEALVRVVRETGRLDAVVACAGITRDHVIWKMSEEDWMSVLAVNLNGAFHLIRAATPHFRERGSGSIVLVSSINGERGKFGQTNYAASKAGLIGLAKSAAREFGSFGVRMNVVAPGFIDTPLTQGLPTEVREAAVRESALGRAGRPQDVAGAVLFLCSPLASHVTGQVLRVDGGQYM